MLYKPIMHLLHKTYYMTTGIRSYTSFINGLFPNVESAVPHEGWSRSNRTGSITKKANNPFPHKKNNIKETEEGNIYRNTKLSIL